MIPRFATRLLAPALLLAAMAAGCSNESSVLAVVGEESITIGDFIEAARGGSGRYGGQADSAKQLLLDDLVHRKLMVLEARKLSAPNQDLLTTFREGVEREVLTQALFERLAPANPPVTEDELRRFHALRDSSAHTRLIYHPERIVIESALQELERGTAFGEVSNRFSLPGLLPPDGDLGYMIAGALVDPLDRLIRESTVGEIVGPIEAPAEGWFILQVVERRARELEPFDTVEKDLRDMLAQRKRRVMRNEALDRLRADYRLTIEPDGPQALFARFNPPLAKGAVATRDEQGLDRVLARYAGANGQDTVFTMLHALDDLESGSAERPDPSLTTALEQWIESQVLKRVALIEARRRRLQDEPDIAGRLRERQDNKLVDDIYHAEVEEKAPATAADLASAQQRLDLGDGPLTELTIENQSRVHRVASRMAQERRFEIFLATLRERYAVRTYPERLPGIAWPVEG